MSNILLEMLIEKYPMCEKSGNDISVYTGEGTITATKDISMIERIHMNLIRKEFLDKDHDLITSEEIKEYANDIYDCFCTILIIRNHLNLLIYLNGPFSLAIVLEQAYI